MSTGHIIPETLNRLVGQMIGQTIHGTLLRIVDKALPIGEQDYLTIDMTQILAVQRSTVYWRSDGTPSVRGTALLMPGRLIDIRDDYDQFVEFWATWKRAHQ